MRPIINRLTSCNCRHQGSQTVADIGCPSTDTHGCLPDKAKGRNESRFPNTAESARSDTDQSSNGCPTCQLEHGLCSFAVHLGTCPFLAAQMCHSTWGLRRVPFKGATRLYTWSFAQSFMSSRKCVPKPMSSNGPELELTRNGFKHLQVCNLLKISDLLVLKSGTFGFRRAFVNPAQSAASGF